jgi:ubiquinone/menaquinone biosynthesis C-methylase UbiE
VGDFLEQLRKNFPTLQLTGIDFVGPVIEEAADRYPEMRFHQDSLPHLEKLDETYDLIVASEVLYYLSGEERMLAIRRLYQLLNSGGLLFISSTIAPHTFTVDSLAALANPNFEVRQTWLQKSRCYLRVLSIVQMPSKLESAVYSDSWPAKYHRVFRVLRMPLIGTLLMAANRLLVYMSRPILRSVALPQLMSSWAGRIGSERSNSNIIMLWQKAVGQSGSEPLP